MELFILDPIVRQNVMLFMQKVQDALTESDGNIKKVERTYFLLMNKKTGEFQELSDRIPSKEWKKIIIKIPKQGDMGCEVLDPSNADAFSFTELEPAAWKAFLKTVDTLSRLAYFGDSKDPMMCMIHCMIDTEKETKGFPSQLLDAWHPVSREEAEKLLEGHPIGTYLFRQDEYAKILEKELNDQHGMHIRCFTLTYKEWNGKITDRTLIEYKGLWRLYQDDLSSLAKSGSSFKMVLFTLKKELDQPLFNR